MCAAPNALLFRGMLVVCAMSFASAGFAHMLTRRDDLGTLTQRSDLVVRGVISRTSDEARVSSIRVDKVLKGRAPVGEIVFASDPDHGVRYRARERVLLFLQTRAGSADRKTGGPLPTHFSPQMFTEKYRITSFDPTGYDALIEGLVRLETGGSPRSSEFRDLLRTQLKSPEKAVRDYAAQRLRGFSETP